MEQAAEARIRKALGSEAPCVTILWRETVDSTSLRLKEAARAGLIAPPCLLLASGQTAGRGRLGRAFVSPPGTGLYMSMLLTPPDGNAGRVTVTAAVAVCRAIEETTGLRPKIKWVNDLFLRGKKVCGILAEGVGSNVVVGVGVNLLSPPGGFPPEAGPAGALDVPADREELAGRIARGLLRGLSADFSLALAAYRERMPLIGQEIRFLRDGKENRARVTGVDEEGGLMIESEAGTDVLRCGEITLGSQSFAGASLFE